MELLEIFVKKTSFSSGNFEIQTKKTRTKTKTKNNQENPNGHRIDKWTKKEIKKMFKKKKEQQIQLSDSVTQPDGDRSNAPIGHQ